MFRDRNPEPVAPLPLLPTELYRAAQVRELDRLAIEEYGIAETTLMARAGEAIWGVLREQWPTVQRIAVVCGTGNNGGDGYVLAQLAHAAGLVVQVLQLGDVQRLRGAAQVALQALLQADISLEPFAAEKLAGAELVVDALLGSGLSRPVEGEWRAAIEAINQQKLPVLAVDIPSGLHADSGAVYGAAVQAKLTVSFIGLKQGMFTGQGPHYCGQIVFNDLGVPPALFARLVPAACRMRWGTLPGLTPRRRSAHKGDYGQVLIIGGDYGMGGALRLAGEAAARVGAGLVSVATRAAHVAALIAGRPELLVRGVEQQPELAPLLKAATVIAIGPGLGQGAWGARWFAQAIETQVPLVVDADALNLLAQEPLRRDDWVLTPHPGEAARLLGCTTAQVQADRFAAAHELQRRYGGVVVLKGAGTLVVDAAGSVAVCDAGNPGMASGGMGDVLTGVIAGLLAQGVDLNHAARLGVCMHAAAGDRAAQREGERGMLAGDLLPHLRRLVN